MKSYRSILLSSLAIACVAGVALSRAQSGAPTAPATPAVTSPSGGPIWSDVQDIGNGVSMRTVTGFLKLVTDPDTSASVRPVSLHIGFQYGIGLMSQVDYQMLHAAADVSPVTFHVTLNPNVVVAVRPPADVFDYEITVLPKSGKTWGTATGAVDLDIVAVQLP